MFKNATIFRIAGLVSATDLLCNTAPRRFVACGPTQPKSAGFVPPRSDGGVLVEPIGGQIILRLRIQTKSVPAAEVKRQLNIRLDQVEKEAGRRPRGKRAKELKEEVIQDLLPKAFPKDKDVWAWISREDNLLALGTTSGGDAADAVGLLIECMHGVQFSELSTKISPATAMAHWLSAKEAPAGFSIDRECELKQPDGEKAVVRYSRHTLDTDQVVEHIKHGKLPTRLAMTFGDRVSFVLTEHGRLKKIEILDAALTAGSSEEKADAFDADVAIATGELGAMIEQLIFALGGEHEIADN